MYLFKKALYLLNSIALRFNKHDSEHKPTFPIPAHTATFPIFADNVLPSLSSPLTIT